MQRKALPLESMPASPRNEPMSENIPIAEAPILRVIKTFRSSAAESSASCIRVSRAVSRIILLLNI